eukprot:5997051-Amphidinium_carterae.1
MYYAFTRQLDACVLVVSALGLFHSTAVSGSSTVTAVSRGIKYKHPRPSRNSSRSKELSPP